MAVLQRDLKLMIDDFGEDDLFRSTLHDYYHLLKDYAVMKRGHELLVLHTKGRYAGV
jgi:hypothetical protein